MEKIINQNKNKNNLYKNKNKNKKMMNKIKFNSINNNQMHKEFYMKKKNKLFRNRIMELK